MRKTSACLLIVCSFILGIMVSNNLVNARGGDQVQKGYIFEHESDLARSEPAPHKGPGRSTAYGYFEKAAGFKYVFRKRVLHPGAAIGYHPQNEDEVYYIAAGTGIMQMNGEEFPVKAGDAILTRPGSSHGLKQTGNSDLAIIICYEKK